jgi:hypothetical protein
MRWWGAALGLVVMGCDWLGGLTATRDSPGAGSSAPALSVTSGPVSPAALDSALTDAVAGDTSGRLASSMLLKLQADSEGRLAGELAGSPPSRVLVVLSTKAAPLAYRAPVAYARVAEQLAPGLAPETVLRTFSLGELSGAAGDEGTRRLLRRDARVLADGRVRAAVLRAPASEARRVDVADLAQGGRAWSWENQLVARKAIEGDQNVLASYQALLAVDYCVGNLRRRQVLLDEKVGRLVAVEDNDVFSGQGVEGAVGDGLVRLSRFMTYSAGLTERLAALQRGLLEQRLRAAGEDLTTPKQIDEIMARSQAIHHLIQTRVEQRGRPRALALP